MPAAPSKAPPALLLLLLLGLFPVALLLLLLLLVATEALLQLVSKYLAFQVQHVPKRLQGCQPYCWPCC